MRTTANLGLTVWNDDNDEFNPDELAANWDIIDADYSRPRPANQVEILAAVPHTSNFNGRLVYLTAADSGFSANTLIYYDGIEWKAFSTPELASSVPSSGNFQGRVIILSASNGGFAANTMIVYDGSTWKRLGGVESFSTLPVSNNYAGRIVLLTGVDGGFDAYSLVGYNGSQWVSFEKRGVDVGATPPGSPYPGKVFVLSAAWQGFNAWDVILWNGTAWIKINAGDTSHIGGCSQLDQPPFNVHSGPVRYMTMNVDSAKGINWSMVLNPSSASAYKWEITGGNPYFDEVPDDFVINNPNSYIGGQPTGPQITVCRGGDYRVDIGFTWHSANNAGGTAFMSYDAGATAASDSWAVAASGHTQGLGYTPLIPTSSAHHSKVWTGIAAGTVFTAKYKADVGHIRNRWMRIMPIRIV